MEKFLPKLEFNDLVYELRTMSAVELFMATIALYYSISSGQPVFCLISGCGGFLVLLRLSALLGTMARDDFERKRLQCLITTAGAAVVMLVFVLMDFQLIFQPVISMGTKHMLLAFAIGLVWLFLDFVNTVMSRGAKHIQLATYFTLSAGQFALTICFILCIFLSLIPNDESVTFQSLFALIGGAFSVVAALFALYKCWIKNPDNIAFLKGLRQKPMVEYITKYVSHDYILGALKLVLGIIMKNAFVISNALMSFDSAVAKANVGYVIKKSTKHWFCRVGYVLLGGGIIELLMAICSYYFIDISRVTKHFLVILIFYSFIELFVNLYRIYALDKHQGLEREGLTYIAVVRMFTSGTLLIYTLLGFFGYKYVTFAGVILILLMASVSVIIGAIMISRSRFMITGGKNERN